jgi:hypothetical protein
MKMFPHAVGTKIMVLPQVLEYNNILYYGVRELYGMRKLFPHAVGTKITVLPQVLEVTRFPTCLNVQLLNN